MNDLLDKGAVLQRDKKTYAIAPHIPAGLITSDQLRKLADIADKYNVAAIKITAAQRIALVGLKEEDIDSAWEDLGMKPGAAIGLCVRSIKTCPGTAFCKKAFRDSVTIGLALDDRYHGMNLPNKLKIGVSGCPNSCSDNHTRDIGLMGTPKGWTIFAGGKGGTIPRLGDRLIMNVPDDKVLDMVDKIVKVYGENATNKERLGAFIDRIGLDEFKNLTNLDSLLQN
ncbi:MAG: NAD(P)/FAD-dependent oxidoreductase [Peptostreptococcaceae bacterium]